MVARAARRVAAAVLLIAGASAQAGTTGAGGAGVTPKVVAPLKTAAAATAAAAIGPMTQVLREDALRYEMGDGVQRDPSFAASLYCRAAQLGDAESHFHLGWMYAYGRGVERNDAFAAYFLKIADERGIPQAPNLLRLLGSANAEQPPCMRTPALESASVFKPADAAGNWRDLQARAPKPIAELVLKMAPQYRVEPALAFAIIKAESNFDTQAISPKNAKGLMQLIPETAERFAVKNPYDAKQNIRGGLSYLRWLLAYFEGDIKLVAAAYNAGEGTVDRYAGVPPYNETRAYVQRVLDSVGASEHPFDRAAANPSPRLAQIRAPKPAGPLNSKQAQAGTAAKTALR